jgi:hypothetical protein
VARRGVQRGAVVVKRRGRGSTARLVKGGVGAVKRVARCGMVSPIGTDGGLGGGQPRSNGRSGPGVLAGCRELVQRGNGLALRCGEVGGVSVGDGGELIVATSRAESRAKL